MRQEHWKASQHRPDHGAAALRRERRALAREVAARLLVEEELAELLDAEWSYAEAIKRAYVSAA